MMMMVEPWEEENKVAKGKVETETRGEGIMPLALARHHHSRDVEDRWVL